MEHGTAPIFSTRLTRLLGIEHPILCGGLMWLADARYVAACVNAGAMGFITARTFPDPGAFRAELQKCRELTGGKRFGVNLYFTPRPADNAFLAGHVKILLEEGVRILETAALPPTDLLPMLREAGATVIHKCASVRHAQSAARLGIDAIALVGAECGGHPGLQLVGTMVQTPLAANALLLPFSVGGGIGHGSQIAAALVMGADAVTIGTRMLVAEEINTHPAIKQRMIEADEGSTRLVMSTFRNTYRVLDNADARAVAALEAKGVKDYEAYRDRSAGTRQKQAYETGDWEKGLLSLGQSVAFARQVEPAAEIISRLVAEARAAYDRLAGANPAG
jgi:NAD(P)H-dependent flavin oxidoreductase YrpB (nitropropane dioxygenase family)